MPWVDVAKETQELMEKQVVYGKEISGWISRNFPDLCCPSPHPGAVVAVIRLHWKYGKGCLTRREHGPAVRAAVRAWEERWES